MIYSERATNGMRVLERLAAQSTVALLACLLSLATAWLLLDYRGESLVYAGLVLGVLALVAAHNRGVAAAVAVIAVLNGIPFLDVERFVSPGVFRPSDLIILCLLGVLLVGGLSGLGLLSRELKLVWAWAFLLIAWWLFTLLRTVLFEEVPFLQAALYGRDFLYFALLVPIFATTVRQQRELIGFVTVICIGAAWHALGTLAIVGLGVSSGWLVHPVLTTDYEGLVRIYAYMTETAIFAVPVGVGLALLATRPGVRLAGAALFGIAAAGVLAQFGRMLYYSLALGLMAALFVWAIRPSVRAIAVRKAAAVLAPIFAVGIAIALVTGGIKVDSNPSSAAAAVSQRAFSGLEEIAEGSGTVSYRENITGQMQEILGDNWAQGLGFLHPAARPQPQLPDGSIRNNDVGIFNSLMTMGLIGTVLLYAPLLAVLWALVRRSWQGRVFAVEWLAFASVAWIVAVLVGSITLVTLFSVPGLALAGCIVACALRLLDSGPTALATDPEG